MASHGMLLEEDGEKYLETMFLSEFDTIKHVIDYSRNTVMNLCIFPDKVSINKSDKTATIKYKFR